ncbi:unnamed protein product [Symbiodinium natans]|uniref:Glycosyl transferase family 25 domain-containing protein n=1 Tax=Symbiodinium natans TaxID=878477 RepID=A0A812MUH0_9DINO|nr:unnamed protein product [Symbiodinium natans]
MLRRPAADLLKFMQTIDQVGFGEAELLRNGRTLSDLTSGVPIFWVSMKESVERHAFMNKSLHGVADSYMVEAVNLSHVSVVTVLNKTGQSVEYSERKDQVILACTLSHMKAILTARKMGADFAVFLEDDVSFDTHPLWKLSLQELAAAAPKGWKGIQLGFGSPRLEAEKKIWKEPGPVVRFHKFGYTAGAYGYMLSRKGMDELVEKLKVTVSPDDPTDITGMTLFERTRAADHALYFPLLPQMYTSTMMYVLHQCHQFGSTLHRSHEARHRRDAVAARQHYGLDTSVCG